ncbi:YihY/virulence factor BrkB family protein [Natronoflexus pectinivorans]|uniref:Membrane protein n=1 Tax=Natronoflexus pectinivorans TaxID=682526 RepID=A0A4R2GKF9_9BACT|nr:YihY/virulence factor BrkB family protein [Natronoflexus pectinivorans]TCO09341.1 membrane protein [Natronoflexus pectinivorans]
MKNKIDKVKKFVQEDIWRIRKEKTSKRQYLTIRFFRIFVLAVKRFMVDNCQIKASALTYYSLLSVVPVVALAFAIAKGFGFRERLEEELQSKLTGHQEVMNWVQEFALSYLDNVQGGMIAGIGIVILLWSVMKILGSIEESFNDVWDVKHSRSIVRKFSDYISFVLVATVLMMLSSSFLVFITNSIEIFDVGRVATPIIVWASPYLAIWLVFSLMFILMPNTKVKPSAGFFGGFIAGSLFLFVQFAYITFQIGMSKYNAIYGSFAALPLFLIWMNISWLIVLFGAELSYAFQNEKSFEFEADTQKMSFHYRRLVSLLVVKYLVDAFRDEKPAPSLSEISVSLKLPIRLVSELLRKLEEAGVLVEVLSIDDDRDIGYAPAFDIDKMSVNCIIDKIDSHGSSDFHFEESEGYQTLKEILDAFSKQKAEMKENVLLRNL